ncbi:MAG: branched-chain amino acid ABC transporter permease [Kofleriaceae bacterium]|nr:branched-chain amino acid ABC transporter permease [Kofleriaceae bacterium]MCL4223195.1 branched-chain amino acid ABC transporter permease [Myxococcales bacterium]
MPTRKLVTRYEDDLRLFPDLWHKVGLGLGLAIVLLFPFWVSASWLTVGNHALVAIVGAVGLMVLTGFAGQISLGHAAFLAIGAFTTAVLGERWQVPFWLCLPAGGAVATAVGVAAGLFALRLRGLYLAIVTLGLLYLVAHTLESYPSLSGTGGAKSVGMYVTFGQSPAEMRDVYEKMAYGPVILDWDQKLYFIFLVVAVLVAWAARNLTRSNAGRTMMAVRDQDLAAAALGVNPVRAKLLAFATSSFIAGVAGGMFALQQRTVTVEYFNLQISVEYVAMIVLGGIGTVWGAVAGAIAFVILGKLMQTLAPSLPYISQLPTGLQTAVLFSILVIVVLVIEPLGLFGLWLRVKRYFLAWPFRY